jgi:uncharacterized protein
MSDTAIRLRGHLLFPCIPLYIGKGYSKAFTENLDDVVEQIALGVVITIVSGTDDVCLGLKTNKRAVCQHASLCSQDNINANDDDALEEMSRVLGIPALKPGDRLVLDEIKIRKIRAHIAANDNRRACTKCAWHGLCREIASRNFPGVKLMPEAVPERKIPVTAYAETGISFA